MCLVCCEDLRVVALGACEHRSVCALCSVRLRELLADSACILCKRTLEHVVMTTDADKPFAEYQIWGNVCRVDGRELPFDEQAQAFIDDAKFLQEIKFLRSITESEPDWAAVKAKMPSLAKFEDEQLRTAWVNSGTDISALWKTPVGPVLIINLILWATGASWCDTPLGVAEACMGR